MVVSSLGPTATHAVSGATSPRPLLKVPHSEDRSDEATGVWGTLYLSPLGGGALPNIISSSLMHLHHFSTFTATGSVMRSRT